MSDTESDASSVKIDIPKKSGKTTKSQEEIRAEKLKNLSIARQKATEALKIKGDVKRNAKTLKERERILELAEQEKKKKELNKRLKKVQREQESESESDDEPEPPKKPKKKAPIKKPKKFKGKQLEIETESESESESESDSDNEEELKHKIIKKRAKTTRNKILKDELEEQLQKEHWEALAKAVSGRI